MMPSTKQESRNQVSTFRRLIHNNESFISVNSSWKVWGLKQVSHSKTTSFVNVVLPSLRYFDLTNYFILCKTVCVVDNVMSYRCLLVWPMPVMVQVFKSGTINKKKKKVCLQLRIGNSFDNYTFLSSNHQCLTQLQMAVIWKINGLD